MDADEQLQTFEDVCQYLGVKPVPWNLPKTSEVLSQRITSRTFCKARAFLFFKVKGMEDIPCMKLEVLGLAEHVAELPVSKTWIDVTINALEDAYERDVRASGIFPLYIREIINILEASGMSADDAALLVYQKFSEIRIAAIAGTPAHLIWKTLFTATVARVEVDLSSEEILFLKTYLEAFYLKHPVMLQIARKLHKAVPA